MWDKIFDYILPSIEESIIMLVPSVILSLILGLLIAIVIFTINNIKGYENKIAYIIINWIINIFRSIPFLILIVVLFPISLFILGTTIGPVAAIIPLTIASAPFSARLFETAFESIDKDLIIVSQSFGANIKDIVLRVLIPETRIQMIRITTTIFINLFGFSTIAGTIGAGGIGDLIIKFGYQRFDNFILYTSLLIVILIIQSVQSISNIVVKNIQNKYKI